MSVHKTNVIVVNRGRTGVYWLLGTKGCRGLPVRWSGGEAPTHGGQGEKEARKVALPVTQLLTTASLSCSDLKVQFHKEEP